MGLYEQVQEILNGGVQVQKSDFSLSEKAERILKGDICANEIEKGIRTVVVPPSDGRKGYQYQRNFDGIKGKQNKKRAGKESSGIETEFKNVLSAKEVRNLEVCSDSDFSSYVDMMFSKDYRKIPNIIRLPNLNGKLTQKLHLADVCCYMQKNRFYHINPQRKGSYGQDLRIDEYKQIPQIVRNSKGALFDKKLKNFMLVSQDNQNPEMINTIAFNKDMNGNYLVTVGKKNKTSLPKTGFISVRVGVAPTIQRSLTAVPATRLPASLTDSLLNISQSSEKSMHIQHDVQNKWQKITPAQLKQGIRKSAEGGQASIYRCSDGNSKTSSSDLSAFADSMKKAEATEAVSKSVGAITSHALNIRQKLSSVNKDMNGNYLITVGKKEKGSLLGTAFSVVKAGVAPAIHEIRKSRPNTRLSASITTYDSTIPQSSEKSITKSLYSQVQEILHKEAAIGKSEFAQMPLSQKVDCILSKSYVPRNFDFEIEKAGGKWGNLIPERKMNSAGRMVTYWVSPEDRNKGKMKGQQNLFGDDELKEQDEPEDSYYSKNDRDTEDYQIKPLVEKFKQYNPKLAERMAEKYKVYQWDRETRDLDLKLDFETLDYMRKAKNEPDYAKEYQEEYNEKTDWTAKMLNNRKLAMARLKVGSSVKWNGHSGKITGFSRRGYPNVDFGGTTRTCFVEEIADIEGLEKKFKAA